MTRPCSFRDREQSKFIDSPTRPDDVAVEVVVGGLELSDCGDAQVNDGACVEAQTEVKTINNTEEIAAIGASRIVGSKSILIQPLDGDIFFGHTSGKAVHQLTKGNFYEFQGLDTINVYIKAKSGNTDVAISEFR